MAAASHPPKTLRRYFYIKVVHGRKNPVHGLFSFHGVFDAQGEHGHGNPPGAF